MNKQKQIEEITRVLEESYGKCVNFSDCTNRKCSQCYAEDLYNAGYRKADEVRKETAKEICDWLEYRFKLYDYIIEKPVKDSIKVICKKYGVEV